MKTIIAALLLSTVAAVAADPAAIARTGDPRGRRIVNFNRVTVAVACEFPANLAPARAAMEAVVARRMPVETGRSLIYGQLNCAGLDSGASGVVIDIIGEYWVQTLFAGDSGRLMGWVDTRDGWALQP